MPEREPNYKLQAAREQSMWTQEEAAEKVGVDTQTYWRWENGEQRPRAYSLRKLCEVFGMSAEELGFGKSHKHGEDAQRTEETVPEENTRDEALSPLSRAQQQGNSQDTLLSMPSKSGVLVLPSVMMHMGSVEGDVRDWPAWFGLKQAQLLTIISLWSGQALFCEELQILVDREMAMFDEMKPQKSDETYALSRRQAIVAIAALPIAVLASVRQGLPSALMIEELLSRCAASITACWHLLKGSEFYVVEQMVSTYLLTLVQLAQQPARYQKTAARLASQGYRLKGIIALHQNNLKAREGYCQQALHLSEIAEDPSLLVSALISLASTFYYDKDPTKAAHIYQKALLHKEKIHPLQRSRLYVELAVVYAQQGREQEALHYLKLAQEAYPEHPENDPSFLYAEFSPASLFLEEGLTHLALIEHYPDRRYDEKAWKAFAQVEEQQSKGSVPARILYEITNHQAETALALRNQELFQTYLEKGVQGAHALNSKQRRREAVEVYKQARIIWPHESRIKELADLFF